MKGFMQATGVKILLIANAIWIALTLICKVIQTLQNNLAKIPLAGKPMAAAFGFITKPIMAMGKFSKVILVIDIILIVIFLLSMIIKRFKNRKAKAAAKASSQEESHSKLEDLNVF